MQSFEQYDEICKYFTEGKQRDNDTNEVQKHLQLHDLSMGEYVTDKYALWLNFRMINENVLHGMGRVIGSMGGGITLQIEKKAETAGELKVYIYLIMNAQLNIQNGAFISTVHQENSKVALDRTHTALFVSPTGVGKTHLALDSLKREYFDHFNFVIILCPTLQHSNTYLLWK